MAIRNQNTHRTESAIVCQVGEYKGTETFSVGLENGNPQYNLSAGPAKWARLFGKDADGDTVLMNLLSWVRTHRSDFAELVGNIDDFVREFKAAKAEWFDEVEVEEEVSQEPETEAEKHARWAADPIAARFEDPELAEVKEPVSQVEEAEVEVTQQPIELPSPIDAARIAMFFRTQTGRFWADASPEERKYLVYECYQMVQKDGMDWSEYRDHVKAFGSAKAYVASLK